MEHLISKFTLQFVDLSLCMLGYFSCVFLSADLLFKMIFLEKFFQDANTVSNSLNIGQARYFVGPHLGPDCLLMLSTE